MSDIPFEQELIDLVNKNAEKSKDKGKVIKFPKDSKKGGK